MSENSSESLNDSPADFELSETTIPAPQVSPIPKTKRHISLGVIGGICLLTLIGVALLTFHSNKSSNKPTAMMATQTAIATISPTATISPASGSTIQGTPSSSQTPTGPGSASGKTPTVAPKPTPIVYGSGNATATITLTRDTHSIVTTQNSFTVASDGSGQLSGKTITLTQNHIAGPLVSLDTTTSPPLMINLTVTNHSSQAKDGFVATVQSKDGEITCDANYSPPFAAGATIQIQCNPGNRLQVPAEDWDDTTSVPGLEFVGHSDAYMSSYVTIPTPCGKVNALHNAAMNSLADLMYNQSGVGNPMPMVFTFDDNSITCDQPAGTVIATFGSNFTYNQYINGTVSALFFDAGQIIDRQSLQLQLQVPNGYTLISSQPCSSLQFSNVTATHGTVTCPYTGFITYNWTNAQLQALAQSVAGKDKATAQSIIAATTGVAPNSVIIDASGNNLPQAANVKIIVNG